MDSSFPPKGTTDLVDRLDRGDMTVFEPLVTRHEEKLRKVARQYRLRYGLSEAECGEDDAVIGAFGALWNVARSGKLEPVRTRGGYWKKICGLVQRQVRLARDRLRRKKRGGTGIGRTESHRPADQPKGREPAVPPVPRPHSFGEADGKRPSSAPAEKAVDHADEFAGFIKTLPAAYLGDILILMREGHTEEEIATLLGTSSRTIRRRLERIKALILSGGFMAEGD
jgi:DNA-directed RNA polymerase specialized sigma24 family protein